MSDRSEGSEGAVLEIRGVRKSFGQVEALARVDLDVAAGEFITLLGPSGSGKTTLLRILAGFEQPSAGTIMLRGRDVSRMSPAERGIGLVFQNYALFPHMRVEDNLAYGLKLRKWARDDLRRRVGELLDLLHLTGLERRYPRELSGGQQQRVALGRALAYDPDVILMDEPLGALDRALRLQMASELRRIHRDLRATIIHVTHDQQEALALSDRVAVMRGGSLIALGTADELYRRPPDSFVATFFSNCNLLAVAKHSIGSDGAAVVELPGRGTVRCPAAPSVGDDVVLAVRPRSIRLGATAGGLDLEGVVEETVLLGDERELIVSVEGLGRLTAIVGSRDAAPEIGDRAALSIDPADLTLVPRV